MKRVGEKMKIINGNKSVYELIKENPDLKEVLVGLGLTPLNNDAMLNTVGRMMTLKDGIKQIDLSEKDLAIGLEKANYELKE